MSKHSKNKLSQRVSAVILGSGLGLSACVGHNFSLGEDSGSTTGGAKASSGGAASGGAPSASGGAESAAGGSVECPPPRCGDPPVLGEDYCTEGTVDMRCIVGPEATCIYDVKCLQSNSCTSQRGVCLPEGNSAPPTYTRSDASCTGSDECWVLLDGGGQGGEGGTGPELSCGFHRQSGQTCGNNQAERRTCYTLEELKDPCSGTHLKSVDQTDPVDVEPEPTGTGSDNCPAPQDLVWGDAGVTCGCFDIPECVSAVQKVGEECCYDATTICRLC